MRLVLDGTELKTTNGELLTPLGGGRFRLGNGPNDVLFPVAKEVSAQELRIIAAAGEFVLTRVRVPSYSTTEMKAFAGTYRSEELDVVYTIVVGPDGGLVVVREKVEPTPLVALAFDTFLLRQSLADAVVFVRAASGEVDGFFITGASPRRLAFTKVRGLRQP